MISYCKNGTSAQVQACPQDKLNEILDSPEVAEVCHKLRLARSGRGVP